MNRTIRRAAMAAVISAAALCTVAGPALAASDDQASCVGLASSFFAADQLRDDVAAAIKVRFGIPPGAEVSRFARVGLHDLEACLIDGQG